MNSVVFSRWSKAILIALGIFSITSFYLYLQRGSYSLSIINRGFATTATLLAALSLLIGPLARRFMVLGGILDIRRQLGLVAFAAAAAHVLLSLFFFPDRFTIPWYLTEWLPTMMGSIAIFIWIYLTSISHNGGIKKLGGNTWVKYQQWGGHIAFYSVYLHIIFFRYSNWITWLQGKTQKTSFLQNPQYPPISMYVFIFMSCIILYRIFLVLKKRNK